MLAEAALAKFDDRDIVGSAPTTLSPALRWEFLKAATARQDISDRKALFDLTAESLGVMTKRAQEFATLIKGSRVDSVCLKERESADYKIDNEYSGDVTQLCDGVRATVIIPANDVEFCRAALALHECTRGVHDLIAKPSKTGLAIINAKVELENGVVGEIQFVTPNMRTAMQDTHAKYKKIDRLVNQFPNDKIPEAEAKKIKALRVDCQDTHATAVHLDGLSRFVDKGTGKAHSPLAFNN